MSLGMVITLTTHPIKKLLLFSFHFEMGKCQRTMSFIRERARQSRRLHLAVKVSAGESQVIWHTSRLLSLVSYTFRGDTCLINKTSQGVDTWCLLRYIGKARVAADLDMGSRE